MESNNLSAVIQSAKISKDKACNIMQVSPDKLDQWLAGEGEPSWAQSFKLLFYLATKVSSYGLPEETEFITSSMEAMAQHEDLEKEVVQASSTCDLVFQTMDEASVHYGVTWSLSEKLHSILHKVRKLSS